MGVCGAACGLAGTADSSGLISTTLQPETSCLRGVFSPDGTTTPLDEATLERLYRLGSATMHLSK